MPQFFGYAFDRKLAAFWLPFAVRPGHDGVTITDDGSFVATYGFLKIDSPMTNIDGAHITSGYRWWTAAGARLSFADDGLTFGTNSTNGVCVHFREKVQGPLLHRTHSALTVTVADVDGLVRALNRE
jgi:hypothetical protein